MIFIVISYYLNRTLTNSMLIQGEIIAKSIAELAAEKIVEEDVIGLKKTLEKYRYYLSGNEYILIVDAERNIVTDTYNGDIPEELKDNSVYADIDPSLDEEYNLQSFTIQEQEIYEILFPIKEGLLGFVRVGLKKSVVDHQVNTTLFYVGVIIILGTIAAIIVALTIITVQVTRPVTHLTRAAKEISLGNFDTSIKVNVKNELQVLAAAIDRMRESLRASLERLKSRSTIGRF
ncbi:MAG: HAMP domain-containing protein [Nitrosopumilaceae archaeon]|nr:HAMP domain-containing protein [Nitrosopumilaceae archaeon]NIX61258.1 HAMP domain-containing protein [Nitrosopumilaceae archaeon]